MSKPMKYFVSWVIGKKCLQVCVLFAHCEWFITVLLWSSAHPSCSLIWHSSLIWHLFSFEILHSLGLWDTKLSGCSFSVCLASSSLAPQPANLWESQGQDPSPPPQPYSSHGDLSTSQMTLPTYYPDCFFNFLIFILFSIYLSFYFISQISSTFPSSPSLRFFHLDPHFKS